MPATEKDAAVSMTPPRPRFDTTINYGHLLTALTIVLALGGGLIAQAREQARENAEIGLRITMLEKSTTIEIERIRSTAMARVQQYMPLVDALVKSQDLQDERIANIVDGFKELRATTSSVATAVGEVKKDIAVMRAQMDNHRSSVVR